ncbi:MAG: hypothetical protein NC089_07450 [Bacteroides sp.]|nr:hypothetical protein [Bacteroides sp.]MCM1549229.1 hypothetical protein [Clostridium sp.]
MKKLRQIAAWIGIIVVVGLVTATFVLGISGSSLTVSMLILTMGVSIVLWVLLWFIKILENRRKEENQEKKESKV